MPRRSIPFVANAYFHLYNRGNNRQAVFFEADNYHYFLSGAGKYLVHCMDILAYCLMPTHYHMLVQIKPQTSEVLKTSEVSRAMQKLLISYTKAINKRFTRVGALFQGQFQGKPIQNYRHLVNLCAYIHANPVRDGLVDEPEDWTYSNYLEWIGKLESTAAQKAFVAENFGSAAAYQALVRRYVADFRSLKTSEV